MSARPPARLARIGALALQWGSVGWLMLIWILVAAGVFVRFVPIASMGWADEIIELAFAWMVFMGAAALWREGSHFCVDFIVLKLADSPAGRGLRFVLAVLSLTFLLVFTYYGTILTVNATDRSPILEYPRWMFYAIMPIAGAVMAVHTLRDLWQFFPGPAGDGERR